MLRLNLTAKDAKVFREMVLLCFLCAWFFSVSGCRFVRCRKREFRAAEILPKIVDADHFVAQPGGVLQSAQSRRAGAARSASVRSIAGVMRPSAPRSHRAI
jgi:hypothetical protein